ncbi:uncharacterized protein LOC144708685 [Wolffia australiana]
MAEEAPPPPTPPLTPLPNSPPDPPPERCDSTTVERNQSMAERNPSMAERNPSMAEQEESETLLPKSAGESEQRTLDLLKSPPKLAKKALARHPSKNPSFPKSHLPIEGSGPPSDRRRRRRINHLQEQQICATCGVLRQFDRDGLGHRLLCPGCRKSFPALEITAKEKTLAELQLEIKRRLKKKKSVALVPRKKRARDIQSMAVEDSDFFDFDKIRNERCFRKGQIWAIYDDDDGMPRHYAQISEVLSTNPFKLTMNWLDLQTSLDRSTQTHVRISSGQFKLGKEIEIESVNLFSHNVECERAARELYRIYPRKGSVWALYREGEDEEEEEEEKDGRRSYDIAVVLSSFEEGFGLTMAYLEKVQGFKSVFKRREVGAHAVRWLEKYDQRLISHQIPSRKLEGEEMKGLDCDCWELDPASLPARLLAIGWEP